MVLKPIGKGPRPFGVVEKKKPEGGEAGFRGKHVATITKERRVT